jgi:hypothetical protein
MKIWPTSNKPKRKRKKEKRNCPFKMIFPHYRAQACFVLKEIALKDILLSKAKKKKITEK